MKLKFKKQGCQTKAVEAVADCYVKTMFELNARYGWSKFIVVVPSIAIREGGFKSLEITAEHFLGDYKKRARALLFCVCA